MAKTTALKMQVRKELNKKENKRLQGEGFVIGVINQKGMDSVPIAVKKDEFRRALKENGRNGILKLEDSDKNSYDVMVKTIELSPMKYEYYHIDFQKVSRTIEIKVDVALNFVGIDSLKINRLILNRQLDSISVSGFPQDIPDTIEIDLADMKNGDSIYVSDLKLGKGIVTDADQTQLVASVNEAKVVVEEIDEEDAVVASEGALSTEG
jgi:large subunit ribosomal protein L25